MSKIKFEVIKNVEENDVDGGYIIVKVMVNGIEKLVEYSYDFGGSLGNIDIVDENYNYNDEIIEEVFGDDVVEELWNLNIVEY